MEAPEAKLVKLCLIHSEVSEAAEAVRESNGLKMSAKLPQFTELEEELADVVIRVADMAEAHGLVLGPAIAAKLEYNRGRPFKHGKLV